jgi:SAM-dependent methyltransferase
MMDKNKDVFGTALWEYHQSPHRQELITWTSLTEEDTVPLSYFFRDHDQMPVLEQKAIELSKGRVLDIGCGAGSHALYLQNQKKIEVIGLDSSSGAIKTASSRGLIQTVHQSIFDYQEGHYDTLLLLMNGTGICGSLHNLKTLLEKLKSLIHSHGQILLDSSDLIYLFDETPQGEKIIPASSYYGELEFGIRYQNQTETFPWLYVDFDLLSHTAHEIGLTAQLICEGKNWDYLARLVREY